MSSRPPRYDLAAFEAKVAIEDLADGRAIAEITQKPNAHPNQVIEWRRQRVQSAAGLFGRAVALETAPVDLEALHAKIGQLTLESDLFGGRSHQGGIAERKAMIDRETEWPIKRQAQLLGISRGTVY